MYGYFSVNAIRQIEQSVEIDLLTFAAHSYIKAYCPALDLQVKSVF